MYFIYHCYGGTHTSAIAAAIHLNQIPSNRIPTKQAFKNIYLFNKLSSMDMGHIVYHGTDELGNKVFTLGRGTSKALIPSLQHLYAMLQKDHPAMEKIIFSNTSPTVPLIMTIGGFIAKALKWNAVGEPLLLIGAGQAFLNIAGLVENTKEMSKNMQSNNIVLQNKQIHKGNYKLKR